MINPIEHSKTKDSVQKYKVEPYSIPADIYGLGNLAGRGGWTWYTGSSSWMYECAIRYILGIQIEDGFLKISPSISKDWKEYNIKMTFGESIYNITVKNPERKNTGVTQIFQDDKLLEENKIRIITNGGVYNIQVIM